MFLDQLLKETGLDGDTLFKVASALDRLAGSAKVDLGHGVASLLETAGDQVQGSIPRISLGGANGEEGYELPNPARSMARKVSDTGRNLRLAADVEGALINSEPTSFADAVERSVSTPSGVTRKDIMSAADEDQAELNKNAPAAAPEPAKAPAAAPEPANNRTPVSTGKDLPAPNDPMEEVPDDGQTRRSTGESPLAPAPEVPGLTPEEIEGVKQEEAAEAPPVDSEMAGELFRTAHGGDFDPKSAMDKKKMAEIEDMLKQPENQELSPNQFALKLYREKGYL